jgi:multiple sugar transport system substrate-binding protein
MVASSSVRRGVAAAVVLLVLAAGCTSNDEPPKAKPSPSPSPRTELTLAVYGPEPLVAAYKRIAATYTVQHTGVKVHVEDYPTHTEALAALHAAIEKGDPPDVFLMDHDDLADLSEEKAVRRVDDLLAAREVDFGDGYTRNGLEAFAADSALQCMPQDVSPLVVYYNPKLIELDSIAEPGRNPVSQEDGWSLEEFGRGAAQPRRPGVRGMYIDPSLEQVAPFIWSGGGQVVDDTDDPTTLTLSDGPSADAMEKLLELVRDPGLTFSEKALRNRSPLQRFKDGKLGMLLGFRELTPELRAQQSLTFDVMPLPRLGSGATIAKMQGLCISSASEHTDEAADLLADLISDQSASALAATGYASPSNIDVLNSDDFLQTGQRPLHSDVFTRELRRTQMLPSTPTWSTVSRSTARDLTRLWYDPLILPLQDRLEAIDQASIPLFDPSKAPPPSGSPSPTPTP